MEKKKLNLATIESAIKNKAIKINEKDEKEFASLIIIDRINHEGKKLEHHSLLHGNANEIAASIAMRMLEVEGFSDMIYKAVFVYEQNMETKVEKVFNNIDKAIETLIDIVGDKQSKKKRMRKQ